MSTLASSNDAFENEPTRQNEKKTRTSDLLLLLTKILVLSLLLFGFGSRLLGRLGGAGLFLDLWVGHEQTVRRGWWCGRGGGGPVKWGGKTLDYARRLSRVARTKIKAAGREEEVEEG